jgi:predicted enzyme related to lactoylglutathione lyase
MGAPVIHWEIVSPKAKELQDFYSKMFDWNIDTNNPGGYGMIDTANERGIAGGIGEPQQGGSAGWLTVYVAVPDLQAALDKAEQLGGKTLMPPMDLPGDVHLAMFADPEGRPIGLTQA